jgi:hypothetical protein
VTIKCLETLKGITTWSGVAVTFCGIILNLASSGSWWSNSLSLLGVISTCCGHLINNALVSHQTEMKVAEQEKADRDKRRIDRRIDLIKYGAGGAWL